MDLGLANERLQDGRLQEERVTENIRCESVTSTLCKGKIFVMHHWDALRSTPDAAADEKQPIRT